MTDPIIFEHISRVTIRVVPGEGKRLATVIMAFETALDANKIGQVLGKVARSEPLSMAISSPQMELPFPDEDQESHPAPTRQARRKVLV